MKLLYLYEEKACLDAEGNYYIRTSYSQEIFDRYLRHFDSITLLMRRLPIRTDDPGVFAGLNRLDPSRIKLEFLPELLDSPLHLISPSRRRAFRELIRCRISEDTAVIARTPSIVAAEAVRFCGKVGKPILIEAVGDPWDSLINNGFKGKMMAPLMYSLMKRTMKRADYAVYVTEEYLQKRYPTKGKSVSVSDVELAETDAAVLEARICRIRSHTGTIRLATAGAVDFAVKGQRFVIKALRQLRRRGIEGFEYHLIGGDNQKTLRAEAEKCGVSDLVFFDGTLPHDKVFPWLDSMDVYLQPSLTEALPRAVVEAMSRALPVLGTETGGIPELLGKQYTFPKKGVDAICALLTELTPGRMEAMARGNYERSGHFAHSLLDEKRFAFYDSFAKEAEGGRR